MTPQDTPDHSLSHTTQDTTVQADTAAHTETAQEGNSGHGVQFWTALAVFLILLRLFAMSDWNWDSSFSILQSLELDDALPLIFSTIMGDYRIASLIILVTYPLIIIRHIWSNKNNRRGSWSPITLLTLALLGVMLVTVLRSFHQWWILAVLTIMTAILIFMRYHLGNHEVSSFFRTAMHYSTRLVIILLLLIAVLNRTPWVPLEKISLTNGDEIEGYVLEVKPGFLTVLEDETRETLFINTPDVEQRLELEEDEYEKGYFTIFGD